MKISRQNMSDLSRTLVSAGENVTNQPAPETHIEIPPVIQPTMELCRPLRRESTTIPSTVPLDGSISRMFAGTVAAGTILSTQYLTFRRGIWRFYLDLTIKTINAGPVYTSYATLALVGPDTLFESGIHLLSPNAVGEVASGIADFLVHFPTDEWALAIEVADPVTATAVTHYRGSYLACHLL